jgi:starch-binding outer membrane protein, SusD/RagB family
MRKILKIALAAALLGLAACELDTTNPNSPTQETVVASADGLMNIGVGLQSRFATSTVNFIYGAGLISDELGPLNTAFETISDAERGVVIPTAGFVADIWNSEYRTIKAANDIIFNHQQVEMPQGMRSGLLSLAYLLKAAALGELIQTFDQVAIDTYNNPLPTLVDRATALDFVLEMLDSAAVAYADSGSDTHAAFNTSVKASTLDILNTIYAYQARFRRMGNDWNGALAAANLVNPAVFSTLPFSATTNNPLFALTSGSSGVGPLDAFRTSDATEAQRTAFHVTAAAVTGRSPLNSPLDAFARYSDRTAAIPTYYPDEINLIRAEAYLNLSQLPEAVAAINAVRTDCPNAGPVATDPGPCQAAYAGPVTAADIRTEIYRNRRYELFATGLRWEDLRRLMPAAAGNPLERCWFPYPQGERDANPNNIPANPESNEPVATPRQCVS